MALQVIFDSIQTANRKALVVRDITGLYDAIGNPTGYGAPNFDVSDVTQAVLYVLLPNASADVVVNVFPLLPSSSFGTVTVTNVDLGLGQDDILEDGYYRIRYELFSSDPLLPGILSSQTRQVLVYGGVACCVKKAGAGKRCDCSKDKFEELRLGLEAMKAADECNNIHRAKEILSHLQRECKKCNCNC